MSWICARCGTPFAEQTLRCTKDNGLVVEDLSGRVLASRYELESLLGVGGMDATVWKARQRSMERHVAVKVLPALDQKSAERFARGARIASRLNHPNITTVHDYGQTQDHKLFLVMELLEGRTLRHDVASNRAMSLERAVPIAIHVLRALEHAHEHHVVHRDLKPDNLFLTTKNEVKDFVKVLDFGIAKYFTDEPSHIAPGGRPEDEWDITQGQFLPGTPLYMAPEQINDQRVDARTDVYAMGGVLYQMLTGHVPFTGKTKFEVLGKHLRDAPPAFRDVRPDLELPAGLETAVRRALEKRPEDRFQSAREMRHALRDVFRGAGALLADSDETFPDGSLVGGSTGTPYPAVPPPRVAVSGAPSDGPFDAPSDASEGSAGDLPDVRQDGAGADLSPPEPTGPDLGGTDSFASIPSREEPTVVRPVLLDADDPSVVVEAEVEVLSSAPPLFPGSTSTPFPRVSRPATSPSSPAAHAPRPPASPPAPTSGVGAGPVGLSASSSGRPQGLVRHGPPSKIPPSAPPPGLNARVPAASPTRPSTGALVAAGALVLLLAGGGVVVSRSDLLGGAGGGRGASPAPSGPRPPAPASENGSTAPPGEPSKPEPPAATGAAAGAAVPLDSGGPAPAGGPAAPSDPFGIGGAGIGGAEIGEAEVGEAEVAEVPEGAPPSSGTTSTPAPAAGDVPADGAVGAGASTAAPAGSEDAPVDRGEAGTSGAAPAGSEDARDVRVRGSAGRLDEGARAPRKRPAPTAATEERGATAPASPEAPPSKGATSTGPASPTAPSGVRVKLLDGKETTTAPGAAPSAAEPAKPRVRILDEDAPPSSSPPAKKPGPTPPPAKDVKVRILEE